MKLDWEVRLTGGTVLRGSEEVPVTGAVRVVCPLPAGTLASVTAAMPLAMAEDEKVFLNGYQTWTYCPEYGKYDKLRGLRGVPQALIDKYALDRSGDYHFVNYPNRRGVTHGLSYGYFRHKETFRLIASLDEEPGYTLIQYDSGKGLLTLTRDCEGVQWAGGDFHAFDLYFARGTERQVFDGWFDAMGLARPAVRPIAGYSSWYNRYENITEENIQSDLTGCRGVLKHGDLFQIDDGWEPAVGDWLEADPVKFPGGMTPLAEKIHEKGYLAGLWLAPFVCQKDSALMKEHPDWLLQVDGEPWRAGSNWGGFYALDIDHPGVRDYLRQVFDRVLNQWGFELVKLDFLYAAAPYGTEHESRAGRMIRAMNFLRQLCGHKLILGCGVPMMPAFGRVDYCRVGSDVTLDWDDKLYMRPLHRERVSTRHAIDNTVFRRQLNGRAWLSDPDVFFLREDNIKLTRDQKSKLAQTCALLGGVLLTSDDPGTYTPEQRGQYETLRHLRHARNLRVEADDGLRIRYELDGREECLTIRER
jgi:alpha-galactosidase